MLLLTLALKYVKITWKINKFRCLVKYLYRRKIMKYKLSEIMWVQAGFGNCRKVMPFVLNDGILFSINDKMLYQLDDTKSLFDNLYEICQHEYNYSTVIINEDGTMKPAKFDTAVKSEPKILKIKLPKLFIFKHKKDYLANNDIVVTDAEVQYLSKYLTNEKQKQIKAAEFLSR